MARKKRKAKAKAKRAARPAAKKSRKAKKARAKKSRVKRSPKRARARKRKPAKAKTKIKRKARKARPVQVEEKGSSVPAQTKKRARPKSKKVETMAKKKRSKSKGRKGIFGSQRGAVLAPKNLMMRVGVKALHGAEGVAAAKLIQMGVSRLPVNSPKIKASIQAGLGVIASIFTDSRPMLRGLSDGPFYIGLAALSKSFGMETMAGEEDYHLAVDPEGNTVEMTTAELEELQGDFSGDSDPAFAMQGNFDGDDESDDMGEDFSMR